MNASLRIIRRCLPAGLAALLLAASAQAQTKLVVGYQLIVGPFLTAIADGGMDAALKDAGYQVDWRQFTSGGDISTALASGRCQWACWARPASPPPPRAAWTCSCSGCWTTSASPRRWWRATARASQAPPT